MAKEIEPFVFITGPFVNLSEVLVDAGIAKSERAAAALIKKGAVSLIVASIKQDKVFKVRMAHAHDVLIGNLTILHVADFGYLWLMPVDRSEIEEDRTV